MHTLLQYTVVRPLTQKYCRACGHCSFPCSPVKDLSLHVHCYTSMQVLHLLRLRVIVPGAGDPMYPCMPCWSICNMPASPRRCLHSTSWHAHTVVRHTGVAKQASTLRLRCTFLLVLPILCLFVGLFVPYTNLHHCEDRLETLQPVEGVRGHVLRAPVFKYLHALLQKIASNRGARVAVSLYVCMYTTMTEYLR